MTEDNNVSDERRRLWALVGIGGAVMATLLGLFAPHAASAWRIPLLLQQRAEGALLAGGLPGLEVAFEGQRARVRGVVASEADIAIAARVVLTSSGAGGAWAGGVTNVDASGVSVGVLERPFSWSARREGEHLALTGAVPSEATRSDLMELARERLQATDALHTAGGAASPRFGAMARAAVAALARLNSGEARIVDAQIVIVGDGSQAGVDAVRRSFANAPAPFRVRLDVTVNGIAAARPELQGLDLARGDADTCRGNFAQLMDRNVINFTTGSAAMDPSSREILDALASVALRCDRFSIEVAGHTDNQGARAANMELSRQRADAVAAYLASQGVARERLSARGYGPDRPRADNADEAGRAVNRRIEFDVSG